MAPPALFRAAAAELRRRAPLPLPALSSLLSSPSPQSPPSSCPDPSPPAHRRHLITLRRCPHPASASAFSPDLLYDRILLPSHFSPASPLSTSSSSSSEPADKPPLTWVDNWIPEAARPYAMLARLDKPIGTWLLAWPCMWSITIAAIPGQLPDFKMLALFGCGAILLRGAGCTVNDLLDRDIDNKVERTKSRPFASGVLTPSQGVGFLGFQLLLGLGILLQLNNYSRILGASSLLLVFSYPLMKRFTFWPQAYLGLTFNWGALLGWAAIKESLDPAVVLPLYTAGICWTLVYDTIYAHQDKEDDLKVGVKSTALRFGDLTKYWISGFGAACIGSLALSGYNADLGWPYYTFLCAAAAQLAWQISTVELSNRSDCNRKFVSNKWFGALVFSGILFGRLVS
ncbi:4-hydroxybenzoate polyprenyltransferase, mitochondrial-like [Panicum miliaceum]|uniref:4-hydroxybenzoate polyprenyltransferase, mitochondrial n=1 Tax=Panicum miliaceum TaxID=4540 RepID=A0A3L6QD07_PANMI|nr:4-hydroxybenzoate polyprenyltransferase, mitochondrial-like [Panicum miliaceum]